MKKKKKKKERFLCAHYGVQNARLRKLFMEHTESPNFIQSGNEDEDEDENEWLWEPGLV